MGAMQDRCPVGTINPLSTMRVWQGNGTGMQGRARLTKTGVYWSITWLIVYLDRNVPVFLPRCGIEQRPTMPAHIQFAAATVI